MLLHHRVSAEIRSIFLFVIVTYQNNVLQNALAEIIPIKMYTKRNPSQRSSQGFHKLFTMTTPNQIHW